MAKGAKTTKEKDIHKKSLHDHREAQALERKKSMLSWYDAFTLPKLFDVADDREGNVKVLAQLNN